MQLEFDVLLEKARPGPGHLYNIVHSIHRTSRFHAWFYQAAAHIHYYQQAGIL